MSNLYILIGFVGSGKTVWARRMAQENPNVKIVSPDAMREMLNGGYKYEKNLDPLIDIICYNTMFSLLLNKFDVIIDCCNLTQKRRKYWLQIVTDWSNVKRIAVVFPNRGMGWHIDNRMKDPRENTNRIYWEAVYGLHRAQFEPVDKSMFDKIFCPGCLPTSAVCYECGRNDNGRE